MESHLLMIQGQSSDGLQPKHVKGWDMQTQKQSLPGTMAEAGNQNLFLWMGGWVWEPVRSFLWATQSAFIAAYVSVASLWNTHSRVRPLSSRYFGTTYTSLYLSLKRGSTQSKNSISETFIKHLLWLGSELRLRLSRWIRCGAWLQGACSGST